MCYMIKYAVLQHNVTYHGLMYDISYTIYHITYFKHHVPYNLMCIVSYHVAGNILSASPGTTMSGGSSAAGVGAWGRHCQPMQPLSRGRGRVIPRVLGRGRLAQQYYLINPMSNHISYTHTSRNTYCLHPLSTCASAAAVSGGSAAAAGPAAA